MIPLELMPPLMFGGLVLFLLPGDSPVGFRLPIASLPWVPPNAYPHVVPQDPTEERGPGARARTAPTRSC